jgi:hypothetical protein
MMNPRGPCQESVWPFKMTLNVIDTTLYLGSDLFEPRLGIL